MAKNRKPLYLQLRKSLHLQYPQHSPLSDGDPTCADALPTQRKSGEVIPRVFWTLLEAQIYAFRSGLGIRMDDRVLAFPEYLVIDTSDVGYSHFVLICTEVKKHPLSLESEIEQAMKEKPGAPG